MSNQLTAPNQSKCLKSKNNRHRNASTSDKGRAITPEVNLYSIDDGNKYSSPLEDVLIGIAQCIIVAIIAAFTFSAGFIAESLMMFAACYALFFCHLCTAGTREIKSTSYVSGTSWNRAQNRQASITRRSASTSNKAVRASTYVDDVQSENDWDDDCQFLDLMNVHKIEYYDICQGDLSTMEPSINVANGKPMVGGGFDISGNAYGTSCNDDIGITDDSLSNCSLDNDFTSFDSLDCSFEDNTTDSF